MRVAALVVVVIAGVGCSGSGSGSGSDQPTGTDPPSVTTVMPDDPFVTLPLPGPAATATTQAPPDATSIVTTTPPMSGDARPEALEVGAVIPLPTLNDAEAPFVPGEGGWWYDLAEDISWISTAGGERDLVVITSGVGGTTLWEPAAGTVTEVRLLDPIPLSGPIQLGSAVDLVGPSVGLEIANLATWEIVATGTQQPSWMSVAASATIVAADAYDLDGLSIRWGDGTTTELVDTQGARPAAVSPDGRFRAQAPPRDENYVLPHPLELTTPDATIPILLNGDPTLTGPPAFSPDSSQPALGLSTGLRIVDASNGDIIRDGVRCDQTATFVMTLHAWEPGRWLVALRGPNSEEGDKIVAIVDTEAGSCDELLRVVRATDARLNVAEVYGSVEVGGRFAAFTIFDGPRARFMVIDLEARPDQDRLVITDGRVGVAATRPAS